MNDQEAAARALADADFAQKVLTGEEDYPLVRNAILADIYESSIIGAEGTETEGFQLFDRRTVDVTQPRSGAGPMGPCYVKYYPKMPAPDAWRDWDRMTRPNLNRIGGGGILGR
jgi:hypothetical protein